MNAKNESNTPATTTTEPAEKEESLIDAYFRHRKNANYESAAEALKQWHESRQEQEKDTDTK